MASAELPIAMVACAALSMVLSSVVAQAEDGKAVLGGDGLLESFSLSADRGPVRIEAGTLEFDYKTGFLTYRGGVTVSQSDITLRSNVLRIHLDPELTGRPREIVATGDVRIVSGDREATGGRAEFNQTEQTITLSESAVLRDGPNEVSGERVVVYLSEERSVVDGGGQRVKAVLFPSGAAKASDDLTAASDSVGNGP